MILNDEDVEGYKYLQDSLTCLIFTIHCFHLLYIYFAIEPTELLRQRSLPFPVSLSSSRSTAPSLLSYAMVDSKLLLGDSVLTNPLGDNFQSDRTFQNVLSAAAGGAATTDYFNTINQYAIMFQTLADNPNAWEDAEDENGIAMQYLSYKNSEGQNYYISLYVDNLTVDANDNVTVNDTTRTVNGITYNGIGSVTMDIGYSNLPLTKISWSLMALPAGNILRLAPLIKPLAGLVKSTAQNYAQNLQNLARRKWNGGYDEIDDLTAADKAAAEKIAAETEVEVAAEGVSFTLVGLGLGVAAVFIVLGFLFHNTFHKLRIWNLTRYKVTWTVICQESTLIVSGPVAFNKDNSIDTYTPFDPVSKSSPVPHAKPVAQAHYGDLSLNSGSEAEGVQWCARFQLVDPADNSVKYTLR